MAQHVGNKPLDRSQAAKYSKTAGMNSKPSPAVLQGLQQNFPGGQARALRHQVLLGRSGWLANGVHHQTLTPNSHCKDKKMICCSLLCP